MGRRDTAIGKSDRGITVGAFHLLALEDDLEYQEVLRSMLSEYPGKPRLNIDIISSVATFEALMASGDHIDVFLTDIDLGATNPSGIDLVRRYFPAGSPTQVIYISGHIRVLHAGLSDRARILPAQTYTAS